MVSMSRRSFLESAAGTLAGAVGGFQPVLPSAIQIEEEHALPETERADVSIASSIFPRPREINRSGDDFTLGPDVRVLIPLDASEQDRFLASSLVHEISDRHGIYLKIEHADHAVLPRRAIVLGTLQNDLVRALCARQHLNSSASTLGSEGYLLHSSKDSVLVAGSDARGAFYGFQTLRQLINRDAGTVHISGVRIRDWPDKPFRGVTLYLPARDQISFFKRFVQDFVALYKFNTIIMEMNACMRLDTHPELNHGWVEFARDVNYAGRNYPLRPFHEVEQNSSHQDCGGGSFLEKEEVADLAGWIRRHHIELIPQLPSFTHSYYLLTEHRELAAVPQSKWPDIYCPSDQKSYSLIFDVYDEYIEVLKPSIVHIGHDELFLPVDASPQCHDLDIGELYGNDVRMIHDHLASRGVKTALWGDMFLPQVRGVGLQKKRAPDGWSYQVPGAMSREQVDRLVPKDCLVFNWFWADSDGSTSAALNEGYLEEMGFQQVYGNFEPTIENYANRKKRSTILGGAPSAWFATNEYGFGKDSISLFLGCGAILWTGEVLGKKALSLQVQGMMPDIRRRLSGITLPSETEKEITSVSLLKSLNVGGRLSSFQIDLEALPAQSVKCRRLLFNLAPRGKLRAVAVATQGRQESLLPLSASKIFVGESPLSINFLHTCGRRALNRDSFRLLWDQEDTADLLGFYEVIYQDGLVLSVPIRYGVHLREWNWDRIASVNNNCYSADAVTLETESGGTMTFWAYEWVNPRIGKVVKEIRLRGTSGFQGGAEDFSNSAGPVIDSNIVILAALSIVRMRH